MKVAIPVVLTLIAMLAGGYVWEKGLQANEHKILADADATLNADIIAGDLELDLQRIELELKMLRNLEERRPLTPDEQDRREYLEALRAILLTAQKKRIV